MEILIAIAVVLGILGFLLSATMYILIWVTKVVSPVLVEILNSLDLLATAFGGLLVEIARILVIISTDIFGISTGWTRNDIARLRHADAERAWRIEVGLEPVQPLPSWCQVENLPKTHHGARTPELAGFFQEASILLRAGAAPFGFLCSMLFAAGVALEVRQSRQDASACDEARDQDQSDVWEKYLEAWPNGRCGAEAEARLAQIPCEFAE